MEDDADLLNADQNNMAIDQEALTAEEKAVNIIRTLNANNPQSAHNTTKFSYKDRNFKTDDIVEHMVFHFQFDGHVIAKDSDEARDQEEVWDNKKRTNQSLLDKINVAVKEEFGKDPRKYLFSHKRYMVYSGWQ
jgi:dynein intermediate chain 1, axonemal